MIMASSSDMVTVIVPVYNSENHFDQAIQSVIDQTYRNIQLIVVDDGSTDEFKELIKKKYGQKLMFLTHPDGIHLGESASINLGLKFASGEYLAILRSNDFWHPTKIESQVEFLEMHSDLGMVYVNGDVVDENGDELYRFYPQDHWKPHTPENYLLECYFQFPNNALVRMSVVREAGPFDETLRAAQDHDMGIRIAELVDFGYLDRRLFCYRVHRKEQVDSNSLAKWEDGFIVIEKARRRYPYPARVIRQRKAVLHFRMAQCYAQTHAWHRAIWHGAVAGALNPIRALGVLLGAEKNNLTQY